jgi:hypothetical protein
VTAIQFQRRGNSIKTFRNLTVPQLHRREEAEKVGNVLLVLIAVFANCTSKLRNGGLSAKLCLNPGIQHPSKRQPLSEAVLFRHGNQWRGDLLDPIDVSTELMNHSGAPEAH